MKKRYRTSIFLLLFGLGMASCTRCSVPKLGGESPETLVAAEDAAALLSNALCDKSAACPSAVPFKKEECLQQITSGLTDRFQSRPELKMNQGMLDACLRSIAAAGCEVLTQEVPPEGCKFLE